MRRWIRPRPARRVRRARVARRRACLPGCLLGLAMPLILLLAWTGRRR